MTKRNKLYAALIVEQYRQLLSHNSPDGKWHSPWDYLQFVRSLARKNNPYALALRQLED